MGSHLEGRLQRCQHCATEGHRILRCLVEGRGFLRQGTTERTSDFDAISGVLQEASIAFPLDTAIPHLALELASAREEFGKQSVVSKLQEKLSKIIGNDAEDADWQSLIVAAALCNGRE